uniref:Uncharacterized protein n=1 Tax=Vespula pensylvanica TaxID=30213 RepID=A0A834UEK9_VESPE|nr:hypothetical protein H0235_002701 [Vespula pensylvanica]
MLMLSKKSNRSLDLSTFVPLLRLLLSHNVDILPWRSPSCILPFPDGVRFLEDAFRGPRINVAKESTRRASGKGHERLQGASPRNAVVRNEDEDEPEEERREEEE